MTSTIWHLDQQEARLLLGGFSARIAVGRADRGLGDVRIGKSAIAGAELLGLSLPSVGQVEVADRLECFARGRDLIAAYPESAAWPVGVDIVWRAAAEVSGILAAVDAIISVRTGVLDSWPELAVRSRLPSSAVLRLVDAQAARFESCGDGTTASEGRRAGVSGQPRGAVLEPGSGPCCLVFRIPEAAFSYAEMVHPGDFQGSTLAASSESAGDLEVRHRLFAERLEKGVILRARVRGAIVDRTEDLASACTCYRDFSAADPPLGA